MTYFARYEEPDVGFAVVAGRDEGLQRLVLAAGRLGPREGVIIPADVAHGFTTLTDTAMEVVAELDAGQVFPVRAGDGGTRLVEVYRPDMPWSRRPPPGYAWTSDAEMAEILGQVADR